MRFFCSMPSEKPFCICNARSKYSFDEIDSPSESTSCSVKSRTTQ